MKNRLLFTIAVALLFLHTAAVHANAQCVVPVIGTIIQWEKANGGNDHYYAIIEFRGGTWEEKRDDASSRSHKGFQGHLATVRSDKENTFIINNLCPEVGTVLGGYQQDPNSLPDRGWSWVTGEPWGYTDWKKGEPNDSDSEGGKESYLQYWFPDAPDPNVKWNDNDNLDINKRNYYIIEFGPLDKPNITPVIMPQLLDD
jgi:hypothetical protein